jgi:hypothetical protein
MLALKIDTTEIDMAFQRMLEAPQLIEKAVVAAMTETVHDIHAAQIQEMKLSFDNPTPWLQKGLVKSLPYGKDRGQFGGKRLGQTLMQSGTYFEEFPVGSSQNDVIKPHIYGGQRRRKRNEKRMAGLGVFRDAELAVMSYSAPKNAYGNIPGSIYSRMLADLGTIPTARAGKKREGKAAKFFLMRREDGLQYIAERIGDDIVPILMLFNWRKGYTKVYDFHGAGARQLAYSLPRHFSRIMNRYMNKL